MHINDILTDFDTQALKMRIDRLCNKTENGCWVWKTGQNNKYKYPKIPIGGRPPKGRKFAVMEVTYVLYKGPVPVVGEIVHRHTCDNELCVNPDHIILGTSADNSRDMRERDRSNRGERNGRHTLTENQVLAILADNRLQKYIAEDYGVSPSAISLIKTRTNWSYLANRQRPKKAGA